MVIEVTISWRFRNSVSGFSVTTGSVTGAPVSSTPVTAATGQGVGIEGDDHAIGGIGAAHADKMTELRPRNKVAGMPRPGAYHAMSA